MKSGFKGRPQRKPSSFGKTFSGNFSFHTIDFTKLRFPPLNEDDIIFLIKEMRTMKENFEYRLQAKALIKGKYANVIITTIILGIIAGIPSGIGRNFQPKYTIISWFPLERVLVDAGNPGLVSLFSILSFTLAALVSYALMRMYITVSKNQEPQIESIVKVGVMEQPIRSVVHAFISQVFVFLWTLLLIIPGIMAAYKYAMGYYLLNLEPTLSAYDAIDKSKQYMLGNRMKLFLLDLSYLGWYFLGLFTLGILWFWVAAKHQTARVLFFHDLYALKQEQPVQPQTSEILS